MEQNVKSLNNPTYTWSCVQILYQTPLEAHYCCCWEGWERGKLLHVQALLKIRRSGWLPRGKGKTTESCKPGRQAQRACLRLRLDQDKRQLPLTPSHPGKQTPSHKRSQQLPKGRVGRSVER